MYFILSVWSEGSRSTFTLYSTAWHHVQARHLDNGSQAPYDFLLCLVLLFWTVVSNFWCQQRDSASGPSTFTIHLEKRLNLNIQLVILSRVKTSEGSIVKSVNQKYWPNLPPYTHNIYRGFMSFIDRSASLCTLPIQAYF